MKHVIRKPYWNYEKEENWLNEMAQTGLNLIDHSWCKYIFEDGERAEYIYRIELLDNMHSHPESQKYLEFLKENGVEHVASYLRWVYLRKKASDGAFEVYTDIESKLKHLKRINRFWLTLGFAELAVGINNLGIAASVIAAEGAGDAARFNLILGSLCTVIGICFLLFLSGPLRRKIRKLKEESNVHQ